jgi:hypothetical protein
MSGKKGFSGQESEVARWHLLSGLPDNVTDEGEVIEPTAGQRIQAEKDLLRCDIAGLRSREVPHDVGDMARLAASYLLAGDVETARRYVNAAREVLGKRE